MLGLFFKKNIEPELGGKVIAKLIGDQRLRKTVKNKKQLQKLLKEIEEKDWNVLITL